MHLDRCKIPSESEYRYTSTEDNSPSPNTHIPLEFSPACTLQRTKRHFLKIFLDFSFLLCIVPYRIVESVDNYVKQKFVVQQFLCCIFQFMAVLDLLTSLRFFNVRDIASNPKMYFEIIINAIHIVVIICFCHTLWKRGDLLCSLVKKLQRCPIVSTWYSKRITIIMSTLMVVDTVFALLTPILTFRFGIHTRRAPWNELYDLHVSRGRFMLFMEDGISNSFNSTSIPFKRASSPVFPNICFAIFSYMSMASQWVIIYMVDIIMNVMALTLWSATSYFTNRLKQQQDDCKEIIGHYEMLKMLSNEINCIIGTVTLTYTVDSILYYATHMEAIFTGNDWFSNFVVIEFFCSSVNWLHFASNACLQMDQFREWIRQRDNRSHLPTKSVSIMLLIDEISTNTVALSGNGLFVVNYKFVAQALTTLMTYFIIVIQLNQAQK